MCNAQHRKKANARKIVEHPNRLQGSALFAAHINALNTKTDSWQSTLHNIRSTSISINIMELIERFIRIATGHLNIIQNKE